MTRSKNTTIERSMNTLLPRSRVGTLAQETGAVQRQRRIDIVDFIWTLILGFATGKERSIAGLRRAYERATRVHVVPSAFYDRFNK